MAQTLPCRHVPIPVPGPSIPIVNDRGELTRSVLGRDLQGYTFWEFRESRGNGPGRFRRIVNYPRSTYLSDVKTGADESQQTGQPLPSLNTAQSQPTAPELKAANTNAKTTETPEDQAQLATDAKKKYGKDPWAKASGPSEGWQPEAWVPPSGKK
ncbi:hypothetical protein COL516b_003090 [Colletotrichum fioriniae]|nr:uncharacterized protein COL516b_003090 [Colletotrichum fioriniae]KAJ0309192.1 hypothetical protein COL516b_003090 [Colletotrichum fioriniae]